MAADDLLVGHGSQDGQGQLGPDTGGSQQDPEQVAIRLGAKPVETQIVLTDVGVGMHHHLLTNARQSRDAPWGHGHVVTHTAHLDADHFSAPRNEDTTQTADHRALSNGAARR